MFELLSLVFGGVSRLVPEVLKMITAGKEREHEYRMTQLQLEVDKARAEQQLDMVHAQAAIVANQTEVLTMAEALRAQAAPTGISWVDALSSSVRPVLTYWWCLVLYTVAKGFTIAVAIANGAGFADFAGLLVTEFDRMVIGSIFSFWFVDRALRKPSHA